MQYKILRYSSTLHKKWDSLVTYSKNGTFLHYRSYLEYHSDRFIDHSLLVFNGDDLVAALPANQLGNKLYTHGGLTYGGFIYDHRIKTPQMLIIFNELVKYLKANNFEELIYKAIPHIYHKFPAEEDLYSLFVNGFTLIKREPSSTINISLSGVSGKKRNIFNKLIKENLIVEQTSDCTHLIELANSNLIEKYGVKAVHTPDEMNLLKSRFPKNIIIYSVFKNSILLGGAILYITDTVVHSQYLINSTEGRQIRMMDFLITYLVDKYAEKYTWFDFGISSENGGRFLNEGLIQQKEGFGASTICYDTYSLKI